MKSRLGGVMMLHMKKLVLAVLVTAAYLSFQNCSNTSQSPSETTPSQSVSDTEFGGTGGGYDGKVFKHIDPTQACTDGTNVKSAIGIPTGTNNYFLIRANCQNIKPQSLNAATIQIVSETQIVYQSEIYIAPAVLPPPAGTLVEECYGSTSALGFAGTLTVTVSNSNGIYLIRVLMTNPSLGWTRSSADDETVTQSSGPTYSSTSITFNRAAIDRSGTLALDDFILSDIQGTSGRGTEETFILTGLSCR